jgi:hypothetical protein
LSSSEPENKKKQTNHNPAMRSIIPISNPDMDEEAAYIPIRIYPAITPIFNGVYVRFRLSLRMTRTDFAYGEICGLFFFILFMDVTLPDGQFSFR